MSDLDDGPIYYASTELKTKAYVSNMEQYKNLYKKSIEDPDEFWVEIANQLFWKVNPSQKDVCRYNFDITKGPAFVRFFENASTNICYNVLDRQVMNGYGDQVAFYWEGNEIEVGRRITYSELLKDVCKFSNVLKKNGVTKGDRVAIYMPMITELIVAMLSCARIGAVHSIVFGGYSAESLAERIIDANCFLLVTADGGWRGTKLINLKKIVDNATEICEKNGHSLKTRIIVSHLGGAGKTDTSQNRKAMQKSDEMNDSKGIDLWWHDEMSKAEASCEPVWVDSEHPLFILYTSGSTGKPKGILHTTGGYMVYAFSTFKYVFNYIPDDIYFCTADIGWITGHTYVVYGPMLNAATSIMFEGVPFHPDPSRFWNIVDKYKVTTFYTAPTAIRALMRYGDDYVKKSSRASLKLLGSVGEPINPEAWIWYYNIVGNQQCSIVDTFWQTETGGIVITPLPGCTPMKPGSATFPFFGVLPKLLKEDGTEIDGEGEGYLVFKRPWPGMMRTVFGSTERYETTYFKKFNGYYCTGDGARRDKDGFFWITGRVDDMLNVSGHLLSTAAVESAIITHTSVAEAAVVSHPHPIKGECLYCFIVLKEGKSFDESVAKEIKEKVRYWIGPFATPEYLHIAAGLPKTRSGKIMRRVLRKIAANDHDLGDLTSLADDAVIEKLFTTRPSI